MLYFLKALNKVIMFEIMYTIRQNVNKKNQESYFYVLIFLEVLILWIPFAQPRFAMDSYLLSSSNSLHENALVYARSARLLMAGFMEICACFKINTIIIMRVSWILSLFSIYIATILLFQFNLKFVTSKILSALAAIFLIQSIFVVELLYFVEFSGFMCFGILMSVISAIYMLNALERSEKISYIKSIIFSCLTGFSYQGVMAYLIVIPILYLFKQKQTVKSFIRNNIMIACNYGITNIFDLIVMKFFGGDRVSSNVNFIDSFFNALDKFVSNILFRTAYILPSGFYLGAIGVAVFIIGICWIKCGKKTEKLFILIYVVVGTILTSIVPHMMIPADSQWIQPRTVVAGGAFLGILLTYFVLYIDWYPEQIKKVWLIGSAIFFVLQCDSWGRIAISQQKVNAVDQFRVEYLLKQIEKYEQESGIEVKKVSFYHDSIPTYSYSGIYPTGDMLVTSFSQDWSIELCLKYYLELDLEVSENDLQIKQYFSNNNWNMFDEGQIIFKGDTIHLCMY